MQHISIFFFIIRSYIGSIQYDYIFYHIYEIEIGYLDI